MVDLDLFLREVLGGSDLVFKFTDIDDVFKLARLDF